MKIMMSKNDEKLESTATQIVAAIISNSIYMDKIAKTGVDSEDIEDMIVDLGFRVAEKIINESKKRSNEKSKN